MADGPRTTQLPYDLLEKFFHYAAAKRTIRLRTMSLVCRDWRRLSQQALFSVVRVDPLQKNGLFHAGSPLVDYVKVIYLVDHTHFPAQSVTSNELLLLRSFAFFLSNLQSPQIIHIAHPRFGRWDDLPVDIMAPILEQLRVPLFETVVVHTVSRSSPILLLTEAFRARNVFIANVRGPRPVGLPPPTLIPIQSTLTSLEVAGNHGIATLVSYCQFNAQLLKRLFKNVHHLTLHYTAMKNPTLEDPYLGDFLSTFEAPLTLRVYLSRVSEASRQDMTRLHQIVSSLWRLEIILQLGKIPQNKIEQQASYHVLPFLVNLTAPSSLTSFSLECNASLSDSDSDPLPTPMGLLKAVHGMARNLTVPLNSYYNLEEVFMTTRLNVPFDEPSLISGSYPEFLSGLQLPTAAVTCTIEALPPEAQVIQSRLF